MWGSDPDRFFIDCDENCNFYLIPLSKKEEWRNWLVAAYDEPESPAPSFTRPIEGWHKVSFFDPYVDPFLSDEAFPTEDD